MSILMYADDIVLLLESTANLQSQLDCLNEWCFQWKMDINENKAKWSISGEKNLSILQTYSLSVVKGVLCYYKCLGLWFNQHLDMIHAAREIAKSATRALGAIIVKVKALGGIFYKCFQKLHESSDEQILKCASCV